MKKYIPSVKINNELKENFILELKSNIYALEKGKFNKNLDSNTVNKVIKQLKDASSSLENAICSGEENIKAIYDDAVKQLDNLKKQEKQTLSNHLELASDDLVFTINLWKDAIDGVVVLDTFDKITEAKLSRKQRKVDKKLTELEEIKTCFINNDDRLEGEINNLEKDLQEYENKMIDENNERIINDLFRNIKSTKSKIEILNIRRNNYSACYNLLDLIYTNAKEIFEASNFVQEEIDKAKALLSMDKLRNVLTEPDKAIAILKRMDSDIKAIAHKTDIIDDKVFSVDTGTTKVTDDALAYKEELMKKKKEKDYLNNVVDEIDTNKKNNKNDVSLEEK